MNFGGTLAVAVLGAVIFSGHEESRHELRVAHRQGTRTYRSLEVAYYFNPNPRAIITLWQALYLACNDRAFITTMGG